MPRQLRISGGDLIIPTGAVDNEAVASTTVIDADKLQHLFKPGTNFDLAIGDTPVAREEIIHVASTAGTIRAFHALLNETGTTTNVDFDLKVNGASVLSSAVNITNGNGDRDVVDGTVSSVSFNADDVISVSLAVTSSTGAQGPFAWVELEENAA